MLTRGAAEAAAALSRSANALSNTIATSAAAANDSIGKTTHNVSELMTRSAAEASATLTRSANALNATIANSAGLAGETIGKTSAAAADQLAKSAAAASEAIGRSANEAEATLAGMSAEVARNISGRADEISTAVTQRVGEMTQLLDERSNGLLTAISGKGHELAGEVGRITDQAVKAIEAKSFVFTQTMMENSEEIARLINDASLTATAAMTRSLGQLQEGTQGVSDAAKTTITRTLEDVHRAPAAIEESKQTASATVADMLETHGMLRSDTTALFERLREANILLQEVLSGAHDNMSTLERTMVTRVSEFVAAMNEVSVKASATNARVGHQHVGTFNAVTAKVLQDLGELASQFSTHGRSLAEAVELLEKQQSHVPRTG